jgi:hypothetical protein
VTTIVFKFLESKKSIDCLHYWHSDIQIFRCLIVSYLLNKNYYQISSNISMLSNDLCSLIKNICQRWNKLIEPIELVARNCYCYQWWYRQVFTVILEGCWTSQIIKKACVNEWCTAFWKFCCNQLSQIWSHHAHNVGDNVEWSKNSGSDHTTSRWTFILNLK